MNIASKGVDGRATSRENTSSVPKESVSCDRCQESESSKTQVQFAITMDLTDSDEAPSSSFDSEAHPAAVTLFVGGRVSWLVIFSMPPSPTASRVLRIHTTSVTSLFFSSDNERLYTGDASGTVSIIATRSFRPLAKWKAHEDGVLGVEEWIPSNGVSSCYNDTKLKCRAITYVFTAFSLSCSL